MRLLPRVFWLTSLIPLFTTAALASNGVLEINQSCVVNTGCFSGDTPGWPVTIDGSAGKSYRLTSSLSLPNGSTTGIEISTTLQSSASGTTIDLNGFTVGCFPGICNAGTGFGIRANTSPPIPTTTVRVRNGTVQGVGSFGISLGILSIVEDVVAGGNRGLGILVGEHSTVTRTRAIENGGRGIFAGATATLSDNTSSLNGADGIEAGSGSNVSGNIASQNGGAGINAGPGSTLSKNVSHQNEAAGFLIGPGSTVSGNTAYSNGGQGIFAASGCTIVSNASYENGDATFPANDDGIECTSGCVVRGNSVRANSGVGLRLGADSAYRDNVVSSNTAGTVTGGVNLGSNSCNGAASCP